MATKIIKNRKAAVAKAKAKGVDAATARKRNYVRTRAAEMGAKGMKADKKALRTKFERGEVSRKGFYAKGEGAAKRKAEAKRRASKGSGATTTPKPPVVPPKPRGDLPGSGPATTTRPAGVKPPTGGRPSGYGDPGTSRGSRSRITRNPRGT